MHQAIVLASNKIERQVVLLTISFCAILLPARKYAPPMEVGAPRDLTAVPTSLGVPHHDVGVNSGQRLGENTSMTPEANRCK